jgi:peptidoglycan-associated lipoprotein
MAGFSERSTWEPEMQRHGHPALAAILVPLFFAACASKPIPTTPAAPVAAPVTQASPSPATPSIAPAPVASTLPAHLDPNSALNREHSVYFKFDDSIVGDEFRAVVERHGAYLKEHPGVHATVQGNTDERGGAEYNLALGQRRADAVKAAMKIYGASDAQIEATSFGKEKPVAKGHDEDAWRQNRRADIVYAR